MNNRPGWFLFSILALLALALPAAAQSTHPQTRKGFWFGGGLGYGSLGCENCNDRRGSGSGYIKLGGTVSQKVLLGFEGNGWVKSENNATASMVNSNAVVYFYPSATGGFHLKLGVGAASAKLELNTGGGTTFSSTKTGGGGLLGLGYDARIGRNVSLVPFFNLLGARIDGTNLNFFQLGLGITAH